MADSKNISESGEGKLHKQKRALLTRAELLRSARAIFARDGFEHARLEDIAARARKTRGAFYANFKDKEEVFFAIFEEDIDRDMAQLEPLLLGLPTVPQRIDALGEYLSELSKDRERILLNLEFKLYAIRHPQKRRRLADLHGVAGLHSFLPELARLLLQISVHSGDGEIGSHGELIDSLAIGGIMEGLALSHLFDPEALGSQDVARYLKLCLRGTLKGFLERDEEKEK